MKQADTIVCIRICWKSILSLSGRMRTQSKRGCFHGRGIPIGRAAAAGAKPRACYHLESRGGSDFSNQSSTGVGDARLLKNDTSAWCKHSYIRYKIQFGYYFSRCELAIGRRFIFVSCADTFFGFLIHTVRFRYFLQCFVKGEVVQ